MKHSLQNLNDHTQPFRRVGIAMATYKPNAAFFEKQIQSIMNQTDPDWVCVIYDDASGEAFTSMIRSLISKDERFIFFEGTQNHGSFKAFEKALFLVPKDRELVCCCDQDDFWAPSKLETLKRHFTADDVMLVHSDQILIDDTDQMIIPSRWGAEGRKMAPQSVAALLFRNQVTGCAMMFRREILDVVLPFESREVRYSSYHHDWLIAVVAASMGQVVALPEPLIHYRQHANNVVGARLGLQLKSVSSYIKSAERAYQERTALIQFIVTRFKDLGLGDLGPKVIEQAQISLKGPWSMFTFAFKTYRAKLSTLKVSILLVVGYLKCSLFKMSSNGWRSNNQ